ncbi:MAG: Maf family protein, partial [Rhodanobacteraceae bacterium]
NAPRIVLASTSRYRAQLLGRIVQHFEQASPGVDETARPGEAPPARAARLADAKARAVAAKRRDALVIGSDQVAALGDTVLHKPGDAQNAHQQLRTSSRKTVDFYTAACVIDTRDGHRQAILDHTRVAFRELTDAEIDRYIAHESPLDCAGSFRAEGAGIALFERIESADPTALIGLPLIALAKALRDSGLAIP